MNSDKGLVTVTIGGADLELKFRARALQVLTKLTGESPPKYMRRLEGASADDFGAMSTLCDFDFLVTLLMAGLATHPKFGRQREETLRDKLLTLLEDEADKTGAALWQVPARVLTEILPAVLGGMGLTGGDKEESKKPVGNDGPTTGIGIGDS